MSINSFISSCLSWQTENISTMMYPLILYSFLAVIIATLVGKALFKHNSGDRKKDDEGATGKKQYRVADYVAQ